VNGKKNAKTLLQNKKKRIWLNFRLVLDERGPVVVVEIVVLYSLSTLDFFLFIV